MVGQSIAENLEKVRARILSACRRVGRNSSEVRLVAVSKTHSIEKVREAFADKQKLFGENYAQEAVPKQQALPQAEWHFIGALQSNKVKQIIGGFALVHSVDRESVLKEISKRAVERGVTQDILLEINLAAESSKSGVDWNAAEALYQSARQLPGVRVRGLMGMPPPGAAEASRSYFRELREKLSEWKRTFNDEALCELSMGTSQDFEVAIEEGATLVRIGTDIFGQRSYT